jgi:RNA-directed DNA polymerase
LTEFGVLTFSKNAEGHAAGGAIASRSGDPARSKSLGMYEVLHAENRETPWSPVLAGDAPSLCIWDRGVLGRWVAGRGGERFGGKPLMHERGESDGRVVPVSLSNKAVSAAAEVGEGRRSAKGNAASDPRPGRSAGLGVSSDLERVRQVARRDRDARFTALLHHVTFERLEAAYRAIRPGAAPGVDGVTWQGYGQNLRGNLRDLHARVRRGAYRARPSRRVFIPKPDGRLRPLGIAALED